MQTTRDPPQHRKAISFIEVAKLSAKVGGVIRPITLFLGKPEHAGIQKQFNYCIYAAWPTNDQGEQNGGEICHVARLNKPEEEAKADLERLAKDFEAGILSIIKGDTSYIVTPPVEPQYSERVYKQPILF